MRRISVIVPCRNEREYIDAFLGALADQRLPEGWSVEWIIADGHSNDGTPEYLESRARSDSRLIVIENPQRIVSTGLNACLARASGDVVARLDVHTSYASDYLAQCIAALQRTGADNVGGPWVAAGTSRRQRAIAAAFQSIWVVGGARSRDAAYEGPTDTVYLGCWPRASFVRFGGFDEHLVRNQDDEHNLRIRRAGGRIWQSADIRSIYRPRGRLVHLFAQQRQYGYWRAFVLRKHGVSAPLRQYVPAAFVAGVLATLVAVPWAGRWAAAAVVGSYGLYLAIVSVMIAARAGWRLLGWLPPVIAAYHIGYGVGTWHGMVAVALRRRPSAAETRLTR